MKTSIVLGALILLGMGLVIWSEVSLWVECRESHSWWYCLRVLEQAGR